MTLEQSVRQRLRRLRRAVWFGTIRRTTPLSGHCGRDRGTPVDRYYIERFLEERRGDIRGRVLEVMDGGYTRRFGSGVVCSDVLDVDERNPEATLVADLGIPESVPEGAFDCFVLTQTLQLVYDVEAAARSAHRALAPGGVLLATVPSVSRIDRSAGADGDFWRFTAASCARLFRGVFGAENVSVHVYGNMLTAIAFLMGMAAEELSARELDERDERFPVVVAVRAQKAGTAAGAQNLSLALPGDRSS